MDYNREHVYDKESRTCNPPLVFMARDGGYDIFADHAATLGRGDEWQPWSEDESCPQRDVLDDTEEEHRWIPLCVIYDSVLGINLPSGCSDAFDGNDSAGNAARIEPRTYSDLEICESEEDWFLIDEEQGAELRVAILFSHAQGDLDLEAFNKQGGRLASSESIEDIESLDLKVPENGLYLRVFGYNGATNGYELGVEWQ